MPAGMCMGTILPGLSYHVPQQGAAGMCMGTILPGLSYHVPQQAEGLVPVRPSAVGTSGVGNQHGL